MIIPDEVLESQGTYVSCQINRDVPVTNTFRLSDLKTVTRDNTEMKQLTLELVPKLYVGQNSFFVIQDYHLVFDLNLY